MTTKPKPIRSLHARHSKFNARLPGGFLTPVAAALFGLCIAPQSAYADNNWNGGTNSQWNTAANWFYLGDTRGFRRTRQGYGGPRAFFQRSQEVPGEVGRSLLEMADEIEAEDLEAIRDRLESLETLRPWLAPDRLAYMPFGTGHRVCIGNAFALAESMLLLAMIARHYRFERLPGQTAEPELEVTLRPKGGMRLAVYAAT